MTTPFPEGKYMSTITVGAKGQIVIPKQVRDIFGIKEGDTLFLMAAEGQGIAIQPYSYAEAFINAMMDVKGKKE